MMIEVTPMASTQSRKEEKWNFVTHGMMAVLLTGALPFAVHSFLISESLTPVRDAVLIAIFCLCLILMFSASALYHRMPAESKFKQTLKRLDHIAIYFAIAGSYTPIAILIIGGRRGLALLIVEWALVLTGVLFKLLSRKASVMTEVFSVALYLAMGWGIVAIFPFFAANAQAACLWLIFAGGLFYSIGVLFYARKRRFAHVIWHFFVNAGAVCHFLAIVFFI